MTATVPDLRATLGATEIARDVVRVAGPDAVAYLQGQLSQDVEDLDVGAGAWSFLLQPTGKVDAWLRVSRAGSDELVLDADRGDREALLARLRRFLLRTRADIDPLDWRTVALRGPGAVAAAGDAPAALQVPAGWPGVEGADLLGPDVTLPTGVAAVGLDAYESLRIRSGVPALGAELTEATIPAEAGQWVIDRSVDFTKGCFTGQELVARIDSRGGHVPRLVRGVDLPGDEAPALGAPIMVEGKEVGHLTSLAPRPGGGHVALAVVGRAVVPPSPARVGDVEATVVELPFGD
jgi:folate-binding protein YgfZ